MRSGFVLRKLLFPLALEGRMKELKWWEGCEMFPHPLLVELSYSFRKRKVEERWYFRSLVFLRFMCLLLSKH